MFGDHAEVAHARVVRAAGRDGEPDQRPVVVVRESPRTTLTGESEIEIKVVRGLRTSAVSSASSSPMTCSTSSTSTNTSFRMPRAGLASGVQVVQSIRGPAAYIRSLATSVQPAKQRDAR